MKKSAKRLLLICSLLLFITLMVQVFSKDKNLRMPVELQTPLEQFIWSEMLLENGLLKTTYQKNDYSLSESLGLSMLYALKVDNQELFEQSYATLTDYFLSEKGLVYWRLKPNGKHEEKVNAFLDDVRIINGLLDASNKWDEPEYQRTAKKISDALEEFSTFKKYYVDFYDWELEIASPNYTVTYLDLVTIRRLYQLGWINKKLVRNMEELAEKVIEQNQPFFPKTYVVKNSSFKYEKNVNMTEQVYTAYHLARAGLDTMDFYKFVKEDFNRYDGKLFGQYDTDSQQPAVEYESPALYGITILYALSVNDQDFAHQLYKRMKEFQVKEGKLQGVYMDVGKMDTHIFDNLFPLIAERSLMNVEDERE
jgi:hypothetical protein